MKLSIRPLAMKIALCAAVVTNVTGSAFADEKIYNDTLKSTAWVLAKTDGSTSSGTGVLVNAEKKLLPTQYRMFQPSLNVLFGSSGCFLCFDLLNL